MSSLTELRELADKATPGPWVDRHPPGDSWISADVSGLTYIVAKGLDDPDARYIAACSPEVIKALVAVAEAASRQMEESPDWSKPHLLIALDSLKEVLK